MIAALLGWTKLPQWALEALALALVAGSIWLWHHETYESGVRAEVARVEADNAKETSALMVRATMAENAYDQELADSLAYRSTHPEQSVRLCEPAASVQTSPARPISGADPSAPGIVQQVSPRDPGLWSRSGPDISGLLEHLAARADQIVAQARELQSRDMP